MTIERENSTEKRERQRPIAMNLKYKCTYNGAERGYKLERERALELKV